MKETPASAFDLGATLPLFISRTLGRLKNFFFRRSLRRRGVRIGPGAVAHGFPPAVVNAGEISIGHHFQCRAPVMRAQLQTGPDGTLSIGNYVFVNEGVIIAAMRQVEIGDNVRFGDHASVHDSDFHELDPRSGVRIAPVRIERNVWIGRNAVVLPGVTIGENSIVAAAAIVTKSVPSNTIVGGNPARAIGRPLECPPGYCRK